MKFILGEGHEHAQAFGKWLEKKGHKVEFDKDSRLLFGSNDSKIEDLFKDWYESLWTEKDLGPVHFANLGLGKKGR